MTKEELKNKCKERAKIFQQAMESCKSSSPMDCIEWFADRIVELEKSCDETQELLDKQIIATYKLDKENAELRKIAEFQQSSNMSTHLENKKLKEGLAVGSTFNKALNSMNKTLEEERDKYRNMVFDKNEQLTRAKEIILRLYNTGRDVLMCRAEEKAYDNLSNAINDKSIEQFLSEVEK